MIIIHGEFTFKQGKGTSWLVYWNGMLLASISFAAVLRAMEVEHAS